MTVFENLRLVGTAKLEYVAGDIPSLGFTFYTAPAGVIAVLIFNSYELDKAAVGGKTWAFNITKQNGSTSIFDVAQPAAANPDRMNNSAPMDLTLLAGQVVKGNGLVLGDVAIDVTIMEYELP